ncbi:MAG: NUDIX domain-containing protein [bacterium]|nr:NUDIX domain-containing protein [bacterium]
MAKLSETSVWDGQAIVYTWIPTTDLASFGPVAQVYGVCVDKEGKILLIKDERWQIPGGTPEAGEAPEQTLKRELMEEACAEVDELRPLGVQEVRYHNNPNKEQGDLFYQYRYLALVKKLEPMRPDPDTGRQYERMFVGFDEIDNYVKWGRVGAEMFRDALAAAEALKKTA